MSPLQAIRVLGLAALILCSIVACSIIPSSQSFVTGTGITLQTREDNDCRQSPIVKNATGTLSEVSPDRISILSWNIYKGQRKGWQDDLLRLGGTSDIIFLQEATLHEELLKILEEQGKFWNFASAFRYKGVESGVLVAAITQPIKSCEMREHEPLIGLPKATLVNVYKIRMADPKLLVANIHGINFSLGMAAYRKQIGDLRKVLQDHTGPIILAGDFNNWSDERNRVIENLKKQLDLTDLVQEQENRTTIFGEPVDHVMFRQLIPVSHLVHKVSSSDHNPLTATFRFENSKSFDHSLTGTR